MRCEQARKLMSFALDDLLTPEQRSEIERHLGECVGCRAEWKLLKTIQNLMATTQPAPLPYDLVPVVMERIRAAERERAEVHPWANFFRQRWRWLAMAAAPIILAFAILGIRLLPSQSEPPEAIYWSAHVTNATEVTVAPELAPISVALSSLPFVGENQ